MTRKLLINFGSNELPGSTINFLKCAHDFTFSSASDKPASLNDDGYPIATLVGTYGGQVRLPSAFAGNSVQWVIKWPATMTSRFFINNAINKISSTFATTTGGSNSTMTVGGAGGRCVFTFSNYASSNISVLFPAGAFYSSGSGEMVLCRASDEAAYDAGEYFTPEILSLFASLYPKIIRPMGTTFNGSIYSNHTKWQYRIKPSTFSWDNIGGFSSGIWGGAISGTDTYTIGAAPDSPSDWTHGELIQGGPINANTITNPTLQIASRSPKTIVRNNGNALAIGGSNSLTANSFPIFLYDGFLDSALFVGSSITGGLPIEARVQLANRLGIHLWTNLPVSCDLDYAQQESISVRDGLAAASSWYPEYHNELWNFAFPTTTLAANRGAALGFPNANNERYHGWYGLRARQLFGAITPLWTGVHQSRLKRVIAGQSLNTSQLETYRLQGSDLDTSKGYSGYNSLVGVNYNAAPDRPVDFTDVVSYAPYYNGTSMLGDPNQYTAGLAAGKKAALQAMADAYAGGDSAAAFALLDADIRGTGSAGVGGGCLADLSANVYAQWDAVAASYGKSLECYEGFFQCIAPTTAQCTTMGILVGGSAAAASAALTSLLTDYKNSSYGYRIAIDQQDQFFAYSRSAGGAGLAVVGPNQWSLLSGDQFSTPFQTYQAFADYNNNRRRVRLTATA